FELDSNLADDLLALRQVRSGLVARELLSRTADREAFLVQEAANLANDQDVLTLVIAPVTPALYRLELRELLLPVTQHMRLDPAELADFADREVAFSRYRRELVVIPGFQHTLPRAPSASAPA